MTWVLTRKRRATSQAVSTQGMHTSRADASLSNFLFQTQNTSRRLQVCLNPQP